MGLAWQLQVFSGKSICMYVHLWSCFSSMLHLLPFEFSLLLLIGLVVLPSVRLQVASQRFFPAAFQLIKEAWSSLGLQNACCSILLIDPREARPWRLLSHPPSSTISIPKWKTSLVLAA